MCYNNINLSEAIPTRGNRKQIEGLPDLKTSNIRIFDDDKEFYNRQAYGACHTAPMALNKIKRMLIMLRELNPVQYNFVEDSIMKQLDTEADERRLARYGHVNGTEGVKIEEDIQLQNKIDEIIQKEMIEARGNKT